MNTLVVLAAACLSGQVTDPQPAQPAQAVQAAQVPSASGQQHQHSYLFPRLHNFLHPQNKYCPSCAAKAPTPPPPVAQQAAPVQVAVIPVPTAVQKRYLDKVGHEQDYSWVTGELYRIDADGGRWVVRYATADTEDRYHGNILLPPDVDMRNFRAGDLVSVQGEVLNNGIPSRIGEAPYYKVSTIDIIQRVD